MLIRQFEKVQWFVKNFRRISRHSTLISRKEPPGFNSDGLIVFNNNDCLHEPEFVKAYKRSLGVDDWRGTDGRNFDMRWRYYIVCWISKHVSKLDGDFVECGVYKGGYATAVIDYLAFASLNKIFWLLDTFEGLAYDQLSSTEKKSGLFESYQHYENSYEAVIKTFDGLPVKVIKGKVPDTLPQCKAEKICFLSIDMNCTAPEIAAANYFWDKLVPGAVIILDDYGFLKHAEQKAAFDAFAKEKQVSILQLPTGQGIIFKPQ